MVRVSIKGGIWKNSEDEILKAAIQKYGKQQWARVASLLNRKTAKQAKARWHEWLDPSIKKTAEWSREEEEKLLHLAKVLPAQWKTIGPILGGRTATQCQEHYEQLLDQAAASASASATGGAATDATDDLRKQTAAGGTGGGLRPGQIDAHPESKPARPDPVDMDEDELEMLQEARARLANTQGKKAKRKQREKMLATAKRLADLQKRRELKQAGLLSQAAASKKYQRALNRRGEIDFGAEIPFHKPAPAGFHDTSMEDARAKAMRQQQMTLVDFKKVNESQYRTRDREAASAAKRHETRMRVLQDSNEQYAQQQKRLLQQQEQEQAAARPRMALTLPEPTMTDAEWQEWRRQQQQQEQRQHYGGGAADYATTATAALLGDYTDRPLPTPMRTAAATTASAAASSRRNLAEAASRLRQLERGPTPLLQSMTAASSGAMEEEEDEDDNGEDDRKMPASTLPPHRHGVGGRTPTASSTKVRDELGLNHHSHHYARHDDDDDAATTATGAAHSVGASTFASTAHYSTATSKSIRDLARQERRAAKRARQELQDALAALPAPLYEYELAVPETVHDNEDEDLHGVVVETIQDRADVEAAERREQERLAQKLYEARSSVLKRADLPRPTKTTTLPFLAAVTMEKGIAAANDDDATNEAHRLIQEEMNTLLGHDAFQFPVAPPEVDVDASGGSSKKKKKKRKRNAAESAWMAPVAAEVKEVVLDQISEDALNAARIMIETETALIVQEKMNSLPPTIASTAEARAAALTNANMDSREAAAKDMLYCQSSTIADGHGEWIDSAGSEADVLNSLKFEFETLREATEALRQKNDKVEAKLAVMNGGYAKRAVKFQKDTLQTFAQWQNAQIEEAVYRQLQSQERQGGALRIESWKRNVAQAKAEEARLQKQYGALVTEKRRLMVASKKRNESSSS